VVEVEVAGDDGVHLLGADPHQGQVVQQLSRLFQADDWNIDGLIAATRLDEDRLALGAHHQAVQAHAHAVLFVQGPGEGLPHQARGDAENGAGVLPPDAVAHDHKLQVAQAPPLGHRPQDSFARFPKSMAVGQQGLHAIARWPFDELRANGLVKPFVVSLSNHEQEAPEIGLR